MLKGVVWYWYVLQQLQVFRDEILSVCLQGTIMDMLTDVNTGIGWVMEKIGHYGGRHCHPVTCPVSRTPARPSAVLPPVKS